MKQTARGTVPESQWDEGVNALLVDYNFSGSNASYDAHDSDTNYNSDSYYLNLRSGMNLGHGDYVTIVPGRETTVTTHGITLAHP